MAAYSVAADAIAVHNKTLVAATADAVSFERDPAAVEIITDGAAELYFTTDGSAPTVGGAHCYKLPALPCARIVRHNGVSAVRLISAGTPTYSVTVA